MAELHTAWFRATSYFFLFLTLGSGYLATVRFNVKNWNNVTEADFTKGGGNVTEAVTRWPVIYLGKFGLAARTTTRTNTSVYFRRCLE